MLGGADANQYAHLIIFQYNKIIKTNATVNWHLIRWRPCRVYFIQPTPVLNPVEAATQ